MALSKRQVGYLNSIIATAQKMVAQADEESATNGSLKRNRRSSAAAAKMKEQIRAARAKGVPAAKLAEKYGVSTAYVYMIK
jgi:hypothetical protein